MSMPSCARRSRSHDGKRNSAMVQFLLQTGLRLDECSQLMLSDLSVGERSGRVIVRSGKGNEARTVPLNASARLALAVYLAPQWEFVEKKYRDPIYTQRSAHFAVIWHVVSFRQKYTDRPHRHFASQKYA
jgi:site-specific recombinase XerD